MHFQALQIKTNHDQPFNQFEQQFIKNPYEYYKSQQKLVISEKTELVHQSPQPHRIQFKPKPLQQIVFPSKIPYVPNSKSPNFFNTAKSQIFFTNYNQNKKFEAGTLNSMARLVKQDLDKNPQNKTKTQQSNIEKSSLNKFSKSPSFLTKNTQQKLNVYKSFIHLKSNQVCSENKLSMETINQIKTDHDKKLSFKTQATNNHQNKINKQVSRLQFFNKYSALVQNKQKVQQSKVPYKKDHLTSPPNNPQTNVLTIRQLVPTQLKMKTEKQINSQTRKYIHPHNFNKKYLKFKQDQFSTTTQDTPIKQKNEIGKLSFFKPKKLQITSHKKIQEKVQIKQLSSDRNCSIKATFSDESDQSIMMIQDQENKKKQIKIEDFEIGDKIGKGAFGDVFFAQQKLTGFVCAIKKMSKRRIKEQKREQHIIAEIKIQPYLSHKHLTSLYGYFDDQNYIYLILEYLPDGNLSQIKKHKKCQQSQASFIIRQICEGLDYMHGQQIIHRDLKPENIFVNQNYMKIGDFGCSIFTDSLRKTIVSCIQYSSPEQLHHEFYNQKIDVWGVGILAYELLTGKSPYQEELMKNIQPIEGIDFSKLKFPSDLTISQTAKAFIEGLLNINPEDRIDIHQALQHQFLQRKLINEQKSPIQSQILHLIRS